MQKESKVQSYPFHQVKTIVELSLRASLINKNMAKKNLVENMYIYGSVKSLEDYGVTINVGKTKQTNKQTNKEVTKQKE